MPIIQEPAKATPNATSIVRIYPPMVSVVMSSPKRPVTPFAVAYTFIIEARAAPQAPPIIPAMNGRINLTLTPNIAGSVMPRKAESDAGRAIALVFFSWS